MGGICYVEIMKGKMKGMTLMQRKEADEDGLSCILVCVC